MISAFVAFLLQSRVELRPSMGWSISAWGVVSVGCCSNPSAPPI